MSGKMLLVNAGVMLAGLPLLPLPVAMVLWLLLLPLLLLQPPLPPPLHPPPPLLQHLLPQPLLAK